MPFFWKRKESDLERELAHHLHQLAAEYERQGHTREEAMRLAGREFGGVTQVKENCRDQRRWAWLAGWRQDISYGGRMMAKTPVVTAAAVISLALGIGANTAIISLMDTVLWRDLPVPDARQLSLVHWKGRGFPQDLADGASGNMQQVDGWGVADFFSYPSFEKMRQGIASKAMLAAFTYPDQVSVAYAGRPLVGMERSVSGNFFQTLNVRPQKGRLISDSDDTYAAPAVAVVSHNFWVRALGSDPGAVGRAITINNATYVIAGVLGRRFYGLSPGDVAEIYTPLHHGSALHSFGPDNQNPLENQRYWGTQLFARRFNGVEESAVEPALDALFRATWARTPKDPAKAPRVRLDDGRRGLGILRVQFRNPLLVLGGLVALLLLIACVNIANLLMARANARQKELAMRVSLGCSRARLMRQFITESALLALLGGLVSVGVAWATAALLGGFLASSQTAAIEFVPDWRTILVVCATSALALLAFGVFPAWQASRRLDTARFNQRTGATVREGWNSGRWFVAFQMALSVMLVMTAVIFTRNLLGVESADTGFNHRNLILFDLRPGTSGYEKARLAAFYFNLEQRLQATPGVTEAGMASVRPMNIGGWWETVQLNGRTEHHNVSVNGITPSYLPLYVSRMIAGRNFTRADLNGPPNVAIISDDLARKMGGSGVVGATLLIMDGPPGAPPKQYRVVGVAPVIAATSIKERPSVLWLPFATDSQQATVVLRTADSPLKVLPAIKQAVKEIDGNLPMVDTITMEEQISKGVQRERMFATLCDGFGILALVLSVVGLYGVVSYGTTRRRGEIGVRLALGARPGDVVRLILREGMSTTVLGVLCGLPFLWLGAKYLQRELTNMRALDPLTFLVGLSVLLLAAFVAAGLPALRASGLDPAETLRQE